MEKSSHDTPFARKASSGEERWPPFATFMFVLGACALLWGLILIGLQQLL